MFLAYQKEGDTVNEWWLKLFDMVRSGELKVYSSKTYPLDRTHDALDDIKSRKTTGKLLIKI
jgi:NADPH2:quinone reductase